MTVAQINNKIETGTTTINICPWDSAWTNAASATVLFVGHDRTVTYRVEDCESMIQRQVSFSTWRSIVEQASH
jgi:hypothetical protein